MIRPFRGLLISCRFMRFDTFPPQVTIMAATNSEHGFSTFYSLQSSFIPVLFLCYTYSTIPKRALCYCLLFLSRSSSIFVFSLLFISNMITGVSENSHLPYKFVGISHEFIRQKGIPAHPCNRGSTSTYRIMTENVPFTALPSRTTTKRWNYPWPETT